MKIKFDRGKYSYKKIADAWCWEVNGDYSVWINGPTKAKYVAVAVAELAQKSPPNGERCNGVVEENGDEKR